MPETRQKSEHDHLEEARARLLEAALPHVPFDGWSDATLRAAIADSGVSADLARLALPRGPLDLARTHHRRGDALMLGRLNAENLSALRYSEKVAAMVRLRLEVEPDREVVRRGATFFALPAHAAEGAALIWQTADLIWNALGDSSRDINWYSKRAILSGVYSATLLFWLGDESEGQQATWDFLDRRIKEVMRFERFKGAMRRNALFKGLMRGPGRVLEKVRAPGDGRSDLPGHHVETGGVK